MEMKKTKAKLALKIILSILGVIVILAAGYIIYMQSKYYRIEDNKKLDIHNNQTEILSIGKEYSALTYNVGFGAYDDKYTFFMDSGVMNDGTKVKGKSSRGESKEKVMENTKGSLAYVKEFNPDFCLFQETDKNSTRSYYINQEKMFTDEFKNHTNVYASNFHTGYLMLPLNEPHGRVEAGLLTLSNYKVNSARRRTYPISTSFFTKFFDLDRCFAVLRIPVENNKELVLINSHMSAYDKGGVYRKKQLELLNKTMSDEYKKGNYVIVGGDFNHALCGTEKTFKSEQKFPSWVASLNDKSICKGMSIVKAENYTEVPTCRSAEIPYEKGVNYTTNVDGFIISDNVTATATNIDKQFKYSDHNPVLLKFKLN